MRSDNKSKLKFDEIGYWSEIKLDIIKSYAQAYSKILSAKNIYHVYIDAFSGAGKHISKETGDFVDGSPVNALRVRPPFEEFHFIDLDHVKVRALMKATGERKNANLYEGDCNQILFEKVFPKVLFNDYRRGLCLLDPYGLHLNWEVIQKAGEMKSLEIFLNFPVADMNRNVLWNDPEGADCTDIERMNAFWGDETWRKIAYSDDLFGNLQKNFESNRKVAEGFRERLKVKAGFKYVSAPLPMRNSKGAVIYYLFFASQQPVANKIVNEIFDKYRNRGMK